MRPRRMSLSDEREARGVEDPNKQHTKHATILCYVLACLHRTGSDWPLLHWYQ